MQRYAFSKNTDVDYSALSTLQSADKFSKEHFFGRPHEKALEENIFSLPEIIAPHPFVEMKF